MTAGKKRYRDQPPVDRRPAWANSWFLLAGAAIVLAALLMVVLVPHDRPGDTPLPLEFRLVDQDLGGLPVVIHDTISCSCWHGPRNQAQRKYKFHIVNGTSEAINISGGERSQIRLIVAYPTSKPPSLTFPQPSDDDSYGSFQTPDDEDLRIASDSEPIRPSRIADANSMFGVPPSYSIWALPPLPNKLVEYVSLESATFPTVVDTELLLPGEGYRDEQLGHGSWTFYVPLRPEFADLLDAPLQPVFSDSDYESEVIFVGIAVLATGSGDAAELLGFAPAPSDAALLDPSDI